MHKNVGAFCYIKGFKFHRKMPNTKVGGNVTNSREMCYGSLVNKISAKFIAKETSLFLF